MEKHINMYTLLLANGQLEVKDVMAVMIKCTVYE